MKTVKKTVLVLHSPQQMFDLVNAVDEYQQFLPWCDKSRFIEQHEGGYTAEIGIQVATLHQAFSTTNTVESKESGEKIVHMELAAGPFSAMQGKWVFEPLEADAEACRVVFDLQYAFESKTVELLIGSMFDKLTNSLVDAFVKRADDVYASV